MGKYPYVMKKNNTYEIYIHPVVNDINFLCIEFILDLNNFYDVVGVEIINLKLEAGDNSLNIIKKYVNNDNYIIKLSYDNECDSFYLKIKDDRSTYQKCVNGKLVLNKNREIIGFNFKLN